MKFMRSFSGIGRALRCMVVVLALPATSTVAFAQEKVLTVGAVLAPVSLDPARSSPGGAGLYIQATYDPLVRIAPNGSIIPALAVAWKISPDSKSVTFTLREDAKFSDGEPVTAEAAKKSIEYWANRKGPLANYLASLEAVEVLEPYKFTVTLGTPNPDIVSLFSTYFLAGDLMSPKALEDPDSMLSASYGAGPYMLDPSRTTTGRTYSYVPNPHYYDPSRIHWDRMVISVFEDQNSAIQAMKAGQLKFLLSDPVTGNVNSGNLPPNIRIVSSPYNCACLIIVDPVGELNPALGDVRVRKALNHAVNRPLASQALFGALGEPTAQLQARGFMGYNEKNEEVYPYDVEKAKALMSEAGYPDGFTLSVGTIKTTYTSLMMQVLIDQFAEIGVKVDAKEHVTLAAALQDVFQTRESAALVSNPLLGPPNLTKQTWYTPGGLYNPAGHKDAELTKLVERASNLPNDQAGDAWKAVYSRLVDLAWFVPLSSTHMTYFATDEIKTPPVGVAFGIDLINIEPSE